ncbi:O-antigen ligase family protein [Prosthecobacter sp. SYSU 5D2]|uniref:O-antigen ligase family protein n=1 Tax=Prosthecobacter sp. SYSU 5D2 TaxID=3134134 RepID=UPI0031FF38D5
MPQRPPSSAVGATTWRLTDSPSALVDEGAFPLKQSLLLANMAGFLGGYYVLHNQWLQLGWGLVLAVLWMIAGGHADLAGALKSDRWMQAVAGLWALMLVRSSIMDSPGATLSGLWQGWGNSLLLMGFLLTLWQAALRPQVVSSVGKPLVAMATVAACVSLMVFYTVHPEGVFGARLRNWFVYGGWNSVNSGLTFGFAACWAAAGWNAAAGKSNRRRWMLALFPLYIATLLTLSRGALLALVCGHLTLLVAVGWRRSWKPVSLMFGCLLLFQVSAPLISHLAAKDASKRLGIPNASVAVEKFGDAVVSSNPMQTALTRSDNGRFLIYHAAVGSMTTWQDWLVGKGMWADDDCWSCSLHWYPEHLHGVFWDTFVHSGLPGVLGLLGLVLWGMKRAWFLAQNGEPVWIMLAGFGFSGLLFDGDSVWALITVARFEPLLFWTPLVIASARFTQLSARASA